MSSPPDTTYIVEWFLSTYKDPADGVPFEGGYIYVNGGPHDAEEEIREQFPNATEEEVAHALEVISTHGGPEWVKSIDY